MGAVAPVYLRFVRFRGQVDTGVVIGLTPWDMFYVDVQVYNSAGLGPRSEAFVQETVGWGTYWNQWFVQETVGWGTYWNQWFVQETVGWGTYW